MQDARGLAEPFADAPRIADIDGERARFDAKDLTTRTINLELRRLVYEEGVTEVELDNPCSRHSLGVGILTRCKLRFESPLGYLGLGLIDGPPIVATGRVAPSACAHTIPALAAVASNADSIARPHS